MCILQSEMVVSSVCCNLLGLQQSNAICENLYWNMATIFVYLFLPLAGLTIVWKRNELFSNFWPTVEQYYLPLGFHSFGRRKILLSWAKRRLPPRWSSYMETLSGGIADFWNDGSILCTLINTAVPGACPNPYRHWQKTPIHAQEVAYKYLGVFPIFSDSEFAFSLTPCLENKLLNYLALIQKSISKLEKDKPFYSYISTRYVARGMGLYTAEQFKESEFYIYSKIENASFYNVEIFILGPYATYCRTTVLESLVKDSKNSERNPKLSNGWPKAKECYLDKLRDLNIEGSIEIKVKLECDRVKVIYISRNYGVHEVNLSCNKEAVMGSPYYVNILKNSHDPLETKNNRINNNLVLNSDLKVYTANEINDTQCENIPKEIETTSNRINKSSKEHNQNNEDINFETSVQNNDIFTDTKNNTYSDKIENDTNNVRDCKKDVENILDSFSKLKSDIDSSKISHNSFNKESTLEISKYLKELNNIPKKNINLNNNSSSDSSNVNEETHNSFNFIKENYSSFQRTVDNSFRKSCRITRKSPKLDDRKAPVVSGASPLCSDHIVPEDFRKLTLEEKRKKFSLQKSSGLNSKNPCTSSSFSLEENHKEPPSNNNEKEENLKEPILNAEVSSSTRIRITKNEFRKFINIDNINKDDEDIKLNRIVKEKKLFWETVFQNSNHNYNSNDIKNIPITSNNLSKALNRNSAKTENFEDDISSNNGTDSYIENTKNDKLPSFGLKPVDSLCLLKRHSFSKSFSELRYSERKKKLATYKSVDDNLDKCCNISLDNRTKIYLNHVSSFKNPSKKEFEPTIKFKMDRPNEGAERKEKRDRSLDKSTQITTICNISRSDERKKQKQPIKIAFKRAIEYFKNLDPITGKNFVNQITLVNNSDNLYAFSSRDLDNSFDLVDRYISVTPEDKKRTNNGNTYKDSDINRNSTLTIYSTLELESDKQKIGSIENIKNFKYKKRKSIKSLFDVLY